MTDQPETAGFREFARLARFKPSYVTQLRKEDRLVLTDNGRKVRVAESLARIRDTADPSKAGVAQRHAEKRGTSTALATGAGDDGGDGDSVEPTIPGLQASRAKREKFLALAAERDYRKSMGELVEAGAIEHAVRDAGTTLRAQLERLPDVLAPQLTACRDEAQCRVLLADSIEHALAELERRLRQMAHTEDTP